MGFLAAGSVGNFDRVRGARRWTATAAAPSPASAGASASSSRREGSSASHALGLGGGVDEIVCVLGHGEDHGSSRGALRLALIRQRAEGGSGGRSGMTGAALLRVLASSWLAFERTGYRL